MARVPGAPVEDPTSDQPSLINQSKPLNPAPVSGGKPELHSGEGEKYIVPTSSDRWKTVIDQTADKLPIGLPMSDEPGALMRRRVQGQMEDELVRRGASKITAAEANERFPGMPVAFKEDEFPEVAQLKWDDHQRRLKLAEWSDRGGGSPWGSELAVGLLGGFLDPLNLAVGVATGAAGGALASRLAIARGAVPRGTILAREIGENVAANITTGIPVYLQELDEQQDASLANTLADATIGGVGGTLGIKALQATLRGLGRGLRLGAEQVGRIPESERLRNLRRAVEGHEQGRGIDLTASTLELAARSSGETAGIPNDYQFRPVAHPSEIPFYAAKSADGAPVEMGPFGPGLSADADGARINATIAAPDGVQGKMAQLELRADQKFLDIDQVANSPDVAPLVESIAKKLGIEDLPPNATVKDLLADLHGEVLEGRLPESTMIEVQDAVKAQGFDGYQYVNEPVEGKPSQALFLFDENTPISAELEANPDVVPALTPEERERIRNQYGTDSRSKHYSPEVDKELRDFENKPAIHSKPEDMDPVIEAEMKANRAELEARAAEDPEFAKELEILREQETIGRKEESVAKMLADCVTRSIS